MSFKMQNITSCLGQTIVRNITNANIFTCNIYSKGKNHKRQDIHSVLLVTKHKRGIS